MNDRICFSECLQCMRKEHSRFMLTEREYSHSFRRLFDIGSEYRLTYLSILAATINLLIVLKSYNCKQYKFFELVSFKNIGLLVFNTSGVVEIHSTSTTDVTVAIGI
jgi:hypothetical protein